jgi:hypothetical protein
MTDPRHQAALPREEDRSEVRVVREIVRDAVAGVRVRD